MKVDFIDLNANYKDNKKEIDSAISEVIESSSFVLGNKLDDFEKNFACFCKTKHCIGVGNGTDALEIAFKSLELSCDDEVIVQGNTYVATCLGVVNNNYKLVLCDCNPNTYQICINDLKHKITSKTKAIVVVHLYGLMTNMDEICKLCNDNNIILIEDAAQAHGAEWNGKRAGSFGRLSCFSFYPGKNLGAYGDGGAICTNNDILNNKIRIIRNSGMIVKYHHSMIGRNSRLDSIQAAVLNVKLKYLDNNNKKRRRNAELYNMYLPECVKTPTIIDGSTPVYHTYVIQTEYREELQDFLKLNGIASLIHYPIPCSDLLAFENLSLNRPDNCAFVSKRIMSIPMYPELDEVKIKFVCDTISQFYENKKKITKFQGVVTPNKGGVLNYLNSIDFDTKRVFYIDGFNMSDKSRGHHANKTCNEFLFVTSGRIKIELTTQDNKRSIFYLSKNDTLSIPAMHWLEFWSFENDTSLVVLCDQTINCEQDKIVHTIFDKEIFHKKP